MREKVVLGLSGGVDSAVAASLLAREYEVHCLYLDNGVPGPGRDDAQAVAQALDLPFETADISAPLEREVCAPFAAAYLAGWTPLPCALCNPTVKFPALLAAADQIGARYVATGHYARTAPGADARTALLRGEHVNDQSYLLSRLPQSILSRVLFPLGGYDKAQVRSLAGQSVPTVAEKPGSMEICFIPDDDHAAWLDRRGPTPPPGDFVDREGRVLGRHKGYHHYTLGQRRGLGVSGPHRYFVSAIDPVNNRVTLSDGADLYADFVRCVDLNWISVAPSKDPIDCTVRLRHSKTETPATVTVTDRGADIVLKSPARAPTPGQLAVFYQGDLVLASGWIVPT